MSKEKHSHPKHSHRHHQTDAHYTFHFSEEDEDEIKVTRIKKEQEPSSDTVIEIPQKFIKKELPKLEISSIPPTPSSPNRRVLWPICCFDFDRECLVYFSQMTILCTCIGVSLFKVATTIDNRDIWVSLLSSCIGIIIPNPKLKSGGI
jgi:hypothetical protein